MVQQICHEKQTEKINSNRRAQTGQEIPCKVCRNYCTLNITKYRTI